jgi:hypothetical protein
MFKTVHLKTLKDRLKAMEMRINRIRKDDNVIEINQTLKRCPGIRKTKSHSVALIESERPNTKGSLLLIKFFDWDLLITWAKVEFRENSETNERIDSFVDARKGISIFDATYLCVFICLA